MPFDAIACLRSVDYAEWKAIGKGLVSAARVAPDGRIGVTLDLKERLPDLPEDHAPQVAEFGVDEGNWQKYPSMSIVIMIVGSRGGWRARSSQAALADGTILQVTFSPSSRLGRDCTPMDIAYG